MVTELEVILAESRFERTPEFWFLQKVFWDDIFAEILFFLSYNAPVQKRNEQISRAMYFYFIHKWS